MRDLSFSLNYDKFYIANDYNGKGKSHIASIPWESTGYNAESMTALVDKDNSNIDAGMTNVAVHPKMVRFIQSSTIREKFMYTMRSRRKC